MNVYVLMPTAGAEHVQGVVNEWIYKGYKVALQIDPGPSNLVCDYFLQRPYAGVWEAANRLARAVTFEPTGNAFPRADVCLFAGDDMYPDPNYSAEEIGAQFLERFPDGYGIMQPCGDLQGVDASGKPAAARICGSAWFGKAWIGESYAGRGPTNADYRHFYADEELPFVAEREGVMWWRSDLTQFHMHWSWGHLPRQPYHERNQLYWEKDKALFERRKAEEFPGAFRLRNPE